ncbi:sugar nucleotide-binding protein, partial [Escherichia coli]|nr:sugar nucleotide-binding protein [Escherichia coli]
MNKRILIVGANGMLGSSLLRYFTQYSRYDVLGTVRSNSAKAKLSKQGFDNIISQVDVLEYETIENVISDWKPDFLFNCVGIIKQLDAAKNNILSLSINSLLPHQLAKTCTRNETKLIHFSTDCVFSGKQGNYCEESFPDAYDLYG